MKNYKVFFFGLIFTLGFNFILAQKSKDIIVEEVIEATVEEISKENKAENFNYKERSLDDSFKENYKGKKFDYTEKPKKKSNFKLPNISISPVVLKFLLYTFLSVGLILVIYFILKNAGGFSFAGRGNKIKAALGEEYELENPENIENLNFKQLIEKAKSQSDYRRAVRYYHLWILQRLTEKKLIHWNKNKTNYDYFLELNEKKIQSDFSNNSYIYDYIWYGNFDLNREEFTTAESNFLNTLNKLK